MSLPYQRTALGEAFAKAVQTWTYRYNQPNPTNGSDSVGHAAENWMMFLGTNTGFVPFMRFATN